MATPKQADEDPDTKHSGAKGCLWAVGGVMIVLLLIVASVATIFLVREGRDRKLLQGKLAELTARGAPIDDASLHAAYKSRTDPTDAAAWDRVFAELASREFGALCRGVEIFDSKASGNGWTETAWLGETAERNLVEKTVDLRHRIHELVRKDSKVRFLNRFDGFNTLLPHAQYQRSVTRLIATEFQVAFADRDSTACRDSIETSLRVAQLCCEEPMVAAQLVNVACHGIAMLDIARAVKYDVLIEADLEALLKIMSDDQLCVQRLSWMIQGERAMALEVAKDPSKYKDIGMSGVQLLPLIGGPSSRDILNLLEIFENFENLETSDIDAFQVEATQLTNSIEAQMRGKNALEMRDWIFTSLVSPATGAIAAALVRDLVLERFTRHALAIRLYEKRVGKLPADLDALSEIGFESQRWKPWGGQPFGYRIEDGEAILWATIPENGSVTSADPPKIGSNSASSERQSDFILRFGPSVKQPDRPDEN